jgi:hypothetical protein
MISKVMVLNLRAVKLKAKKISKVTKIKMMKNLSMTEIKGLIMIIQGIFLTPNRSKLLINIWKEKNLFHSQFNKKDFLIRLESSTMTSTSAKTK